MYIFQALLFIAIIPKFTKLFTFYCSCFITICLYVFDMDFIQYCLIKLAIW